MTFQPAALLEAALHSRTGLFDVTHQIAFRLFNGFTEGLPSLVLDLYGTTLVIHDYSESELGDEALVREALALILGQYPWIECAVWKVRHSKSNVQRNGQFLIGGEAQLTRKIVESGVFYACAATLNRDVGFYLDTRLLRAWAKGSLSGKRVLNAFAYTGSLGVAARAGGAEVLHTDLNPRFLDVARESYALNRWDVRKRDFRAGDFFEVVGQLKRDGRLFDCVLLDPPFFSVTEKGQVDLQNGSARLLNKVRPLVADGGCIALVNNAVFLSGSEHMTALQELCADGYLSLEQVIPVPEDTAGYPQTRVPAPGVDPSPFNHSTKMTILRVSRRAGGRRRSQVSEAH